mmetsp:Transcript_40365/g.65392  ORF Transcript_40365/g.65392 Transcript_40365/m.65392 type:complete len:88 (+) Transcript_40365:152-415(+)
MQESLDQMRSFWDSHRMKGKPTTPESRGMGGGRPNLLYNHEPVCLTEDEIASEAANWEDYGTDIELAHGELIDTTFDSLRVGPTCKS